MEARRRNRRRVWVNNALGVLCMALIFTFPLALSWSESGRVPFFDSPTHDDERFHVETEPECKTYEDGSYACTDGTHGCTSGTLCEDGSDTVCTTETTTYCWLRDGDAWVWVTKEGAP